MADANQMRKRQQVLADFGEFALKSDDLDEVLTQACRLVGEALGTGRAKVLEIQDGGRSLFVRAGVGWAPDVVGRLRLPMSEHSSETYSIEEGKPVVTQDIAKEDRFDVPDFMKQAGVVALVNVPILVPGRRPYGLLQVDATEPRAFAEDDIQFLRTYATILGPVIDRLLKVQELQAGEERFRLIVESARDYAIFLTDPEDRITDWLPGAQAVFGWTAEEAIGRHSAILFTPEDREAGEPQREVETARREGRAPNVRWHQHKDGRCVFIEGSATALRHPNGALRGFLKIGQDVTERHRTEERLSVMVAELQHRTRNLVAVVRSIAQQTLAASDTLETFRAQFNDRLSALARVQGLLSRSDQEPITIGALIRLELDGLGAAAMPERVTVKGPEARIRKAAVQTLALALHELATNARKHGALSTSDGRLTVMWRIDRSEGEERRLTLDWVEEGLTASQGADTGRGGYGRELIERALPYSLGAKTRYALSETRLHCTIDLPLTTRAERKEGS